MCQHSVHPWELPSTFLACAGPSVDFRQLLCIRGTFREIFMCPREILSTSCTCAGPSVDFRQLLCIRGTFRQLSVLPQGLSSVFRMAAGLSVKFQQPSVHLQYLPSTSVNFCAPAGSSINNLHGGKTYRQYQLTFRASAGLTINLPQLFVRPGDLLTTFRLAS